MAAIGRQSYKNRLPISGPFVCYLETLSSKNRLHTLLLDRRCYDVSVFKAGKCLAGLIYVR
jgi:hypothetical protein